MKSPEERAIDLLVERATEGLSPDAAAELEALLASRPELDEESFELAAAAIELAGTVEEEMPAHLYDRLAQQADDLHPAVAEESLPEVAVFPSRRSAAPPRSVWLGWVAAAAILIATVGLWPERELVPSPEQARAELVAGASDLLELQWTATEDPAARGAGGDLVWSSDLQQGFMRLRGLPVNDPTLEQYQLWIFDAERDERYPVDGGVFDIAAGGEAVVPIRARLPIDQPTLFAITLEKPGGVVVSSRERLPLLAKVG